MAYLMEFDVQSKVMRIFQGDEEGERTLLKDAEGAFEAITNRHFHLEDQYWKTGQFWRDIDKGEKIIERNRAGY